MTALPTSTWPPQRPPGSPQSPFLRLPTELRLQIYSLILLPYHPVDLLPAYDKKRASSQDSFDYDKRQYGSDRLATTDLSHPTLLIRTIDPQHYELRYPHLSPQPARNKYTVRCDRFRARCMSTTYHCINHSRLENQLGILRANKQIHAEAVELLYSTYAFDFDTHVEAIVPFLSDLSPFARSCVKDVRFVKRALAYEKEYDRCEWLTAVRYLTSPLTSVSLQRLDIGVVAGRPGPNGWDNVAQYARADFPLLKELDGMDWMLALLEFRGLADVNVEAVVEHCPPANNSMAMAGYIRFSASVETAFRDFLRGELLS